MNVISAHLDFNKEVRRKLEGNKLMEGIKANEEVLFTGNLNEREKRITSDLDILYEPIALAKHGFKFKQLDSHTYMKLDKCTGNIVQKKGRDRPGFGELDNKGVTDRTGNMAN